MKCLFCFLSETHWNEIETVDSSSARVLVQLWSGEGYPYKKKKEPGSEVRRSF